MSGFIELTSIICLRYQHGGHLIPLAKVRRIFGVCKYLQFFCMRFLKSYARMGRAEALVARRFNRGPQRRLRLFARMGRGGAMERFISACRNPLAKSATTKAISLCDPSAECEVPLFPRGI